MSKKHEEQKTSQEDLIKALDVLDDLAKSMAEEKKEDGVDDLAKAVKEAEESLKKSDDGDDDDKDPKCEKCGGRCKGGKCEKCGTKCEDESGKKSEEMGKSEELTFEDMLLKSSEQATEAFESLSKSVNEKFGDLEGKVSSLVKSTESLLALNIRQAKVIAGLTKSLGKMGGQAVAVGDAKLGIGAGNEEPMAKSRAEIQDLLEKSISEEKIGLDALSRFGSHGIKGLNADELQILGIKA